jgi:hypothetical protein
VLGADAKPELVDTFVEHGVPIARYKLATGDDCGAPGQSCAVLLSFRGFPGSYRGVIRPTGRTVHGDGK